MRSKKGWTLICLAALGIAAAGCGKKEEAATETEAAVTEAAQDESTGAVTETASEEEAVIGETEFTAQLDTEEEVTLNIIGSMENFEALEAVISDFEEYYPNCDVLYSLLDGNYESMLGIRLESDSSVGIFMITRYIYDDSEVAASHCADLSKENIDFGAIRQDTMNSYTVSGKLFALPLACNTSGLIVNTTLLEKEGLSVPENYDEFLEVCSALKEKGYTPIQGFSSGAAVRVTENMAFVLLNREYPTEESLKKLSDGEEGCVEVLLPVFEKLEELCEKGYMDGTVNETYEDNYNDSILKFFEGDVPFLAATTETFSGTKKRETKSEHFSEEPFEYEFICTPLAEDGCYSYIDNWYGFAVNDQCANKEWAVEFMRFLATSDEINELASVKGLPSVAVESDDERFANIYGTSEENTCMSPSFFPAALDDALWEVEGQLVNGETDAAGAVELMETYLREGIPEEEETETEGSATESAAESTAENVTESAAESATEGVTESTAESAAEGVTESTAESATEGVTESTAESATEGVTESAAENITEGTTEGATKSAVESTSESAA